MANPVSLRDDSKHAVPMGGQRSTAEPCGYRGAAHARGDRVVWPAAGNEKVPCAPTGPGSDRAQVARAPALLGVIRLNLGKQPRQNFARNGESPCHHARPRSHR